MKGDQGMTRQRFAPCPFIGVECEYVSLADYIEALKAENERLREELAATYVCLSGTVQHASDCATSNAPAMEPGPCDCAALKGTEG